MALIARLTALVSNHSSRPAVASGAVEPGHGSRPDIQPRVPTRANRQLQRMFDKTAPRRLARSAPLLTTALVSINSRKAGADCRQEQLRGQANVARGSLRGCSVRKMAASPSCSSLNPANSNNSISIGVSANRAGQTVERVRLAGRLCAQADRATMPTAGGPSEIDSKIAHRNA